ncbi:hypothetical protein [Actinomadura litoris]|nr:hypothetical protein [Actinomadura litoris]
MDRVAAGLAELGVRPGGFLDLAERYGITAAYLTPLVLDAPVI